MKLLPLIKTYKSQLFLVGILLLGAFLRLYRISEYMTFLGDEGRDMLVVKHIIVDHIPTLLGPTASVGGFFLGPIYYYFMAPFLWAWRLDPTGPSVMVALFGVATIFLLYKLVNGMFGQPSASIAASVYAISPIIIAQSRSSWNPNVVPFFSLLLLYLLYYVVENRKPTWAFWAGVMLGIGIQLHYLFLFLYVVSAVWLVLFWRKKQDVKLYGFVILGTIVGVSPFLAFELRHQLANTQSIIRFIGAGQDTGFSLQTFMHTVSDIVFRMYGRLVFYMPEPVHFENYPKTTIALWIGTVRLAIFTTLGWLTIELWNAYKRMRDERKKLDGRGRAILLLTVWFVVVVVLFGLYKKSIYDYYFGIVFGFPFIVTSVVIASFKKIKYGVFITIALWIALLLLNWSGRPFQFQPNNQLGQMRRISEEAMSKTGGKPFNFALITGGNSDHAYRYFFEIWNNPPVTIQNDVIDPERKTVTDQLIVICEIQCEPIGNSLWEVAGFGRAEIAGTWEVPFVKIYRLVHYTGKD